MNKPSENNSNKSNAIVAAHYPKAGPYNGAPAFIKMESTPATKPDDEDAENELPEDAINEPLTPVPARDEINPPLSATLGGDDLVIPLEK